MGPGRTGSPQFPGAGRAQGVREPPNTPQVGAPPDPCPVPPQLCISTVAIMITGARPEDTGPPANTHPRAHSRVCPCTHTQTHTGPSLTRAGCLRAQPVGEGRHSGGGAVPRPPAHQAPTQAGARLPQRATAPSGQPTGPGHRRAPTQPVPASRSPPNPLSSPPSQGRAQFGGCRDPIYSHGVRTLGDSHPSLEVASSPGCFPGGRRAAGGPSWGSQGRGGLRSVPI